MEPKQPKSGLGQKVALVVGTALSALTIQAVNTATAAEPGPNRIDINQEGLRSKPMPVLKLNPANPDQSRFVAKHASHSSHGSHGSHGSHSSHSSHSSGGFAS